MLRDRLKGPTCINSFKPSGFFIHRLVYRSEIRRYEGKKCSALLYYLCDWEGYYSGCRRLYVSGVGGELGLRV